MTGTQDHNMVLEKGGEKTRRNYNSSVLIDSQGAINAFYHKIHLVPFSEYFPLDKEKFADLVDSTTPLLINQNLRRYKALMPKNRRRAIKSMAISPLMLDGELIGSLNQADTGENRIFHLCSECVVVEGFCWGCGQYYAGTSEFERWTGIL